MISVVWLGKVREVLLAGSGVLKHIEVFLVIFFALLRHSKCSLGKLFTGHNVVRLHEMGLHFFNISFIDSGYFFGEATLGDSQS